MRNFKAINNICKRDFSLLLVVICLIFLSSCEEPKYDVYGKDSFPEIKLPLYPKAIRINHIINRPEGTKSVSYKVRIKWPAQELIEFYESEFEQMGFSKYSADGYGRGKWFQFIDGTKKNEPEVNRFIETWADKNHSIRVLLHLDYLRERDNPWPNEVFVMCQIQQFFDYTKLNEFMEKMRRSGKEQEFNELLLKYLSKDKDMDIERALKENPDNEDLKEFIQLLKNDN